MGTEQQIVTFGPLLQQALYYATVLFGATVTQMLSLTKNFKGTQDFLRRLAPKLGDEAVFRWDFVIVTIIGSLIGFILFEPNGYKQALLAGIGWTASIQALARGAHNIEAAANRLDDHSTKALPKPSTRAKKTEDSKAGKDDEGLPPKS